MNPKRIRRMLHNGHDRLALTLTADQWRLIVSTSRSGIGMLAVNALDATKQTEAVDALVDQFNTIPSPRS